MTERLDEIYTLIESLKQENNSNIEGFIKILNDIKIKMSDIQDNKEDVEAVLNAVTQTINSRLSSFEQNVQNLDTVVRDIQNIVNSNAKEEELSSKVQELSENFKSGFNSVISFANKDAEAKNLLLDRMNSLEQAVKNGAMIETLRQRTDELVKGYENFISDSNLRHGNMVSAFVDLKNKIDEYSSKNNYVYGTIEHSIGDANSKIAELDSTISSNLGNVNSKLYSMSDEVQKILNDGFDHLKYLSSNISEAMNSNSIDVKAALECLKANILDFSGSVNSEFENLNSKLADKIGDNQSTQNEAFSNILSNIRNIEGIVSEKIHAYESEMSINFDKVNEYITSLNETLASVRVNNDSFLEDKLSDMNAKIEDSEIKFEKLMADTSAEVKNISASIEAMSDKFISSRLEDNGPNIDLVKDDIIASAASNVVLLSEKIQDVNNSIETFKVDFADNMTNYLTSIKTLFVDFSEKMDSIQENDFILEKISSLEAMINNSDSERSNNFASLKTLITENKEGIEYLKEKASEKSGIENLEELINKNSAVKDEKLDSLKDLVSGYKDSVDKLAEDIQAKSAYTTSEISELKMIANDVLPNKASIDNLSEYVGGKLEEYNKSVSDGFLNIVSHLDVVVDDLKSTNPKFDDSAIQRKLNELNEQMKDSFAGYEQALTILSTRVEEYSASAENIASDSREKVLSSVNEISEIKEKFEGLSSQLTNLVGNSGLIEILADIRKQFSHVISENKTDNEDKVNDIKNVLEASSGDLSSRILDLAQSMAELQEAVSAGNLSSEIQDNISEIKTAVEANLADLNNSISSNIENIKTELEPLQNAVKTFVSSDLSSSVNSVKEQVELSYVNIISQLGAKIDENKSFEKVEESYKDLVYKLSDIEAFVKDSTQSCLDSVGNDLAVVQNMLEESSSSNNDLKEEIRAQILEITSKIDECSSRTRTSLTEELEKIKELVSQNKALDIDTLVASISPLLDNEEVINIIRSLNKSLAEKLEEMKQDSDLAFQDVLDVVNSIKNTAEYSIDVINEKFENANHNAASIIQNIEIIDDKIEVLEGLIKSGTAALSKMDTTSVLDEIKSNLKQISLNSEILNSYEQTLKVLDNKLDVIAMNDNMEEINVNFQEVKDSIDNIHSVFASETPLFALIKTINAKLDILSQSDDSEVISTIESITAEIEILKQSIVDGESKLDKFVKVLDSKIDVIVQSTSDNNASLKDSVNEGFAYVDKALVNAVGELKQQITDSESTLEEYARTFDYKLDEISQFDSVHKKLDEIAQFDSVNKKLDEIAQFDSVNRKLDCINSSVESGLKIEDLIKELNSKVDILAMSDDSDLFEEIYEIRNLVETQINDSTHEQKVDNALQKIIDEIDKVNTDITDLDFSSKTKEIKDAVIEAIVSVTSEISFVEETEELKDFVSEKTNDIHRTLMDVKHQLATITNSSGDMDFYTYTLQDVESDLAKLRLVVNDIANRAPQNELTVISTNMNKMSRAMDDLRRSVDNKDNILSDNINDEILSISSRLNKLLLSQEEVDERISSQLENNLAVISELESKDYRQHLENILHEIDQKLENSSNTMDVLKNVMMYLGEWMDGTTDTLSGIYDKSNISDEINNLKTMFPDNTQVVGVLEEKLNQQETKIQNLANSIDARISQQDARLDRIERQLDRVCELLENSEPEKTDNERLGNIEEKLKTINSSIEKLASYVD